MNESFVQLKSKELGISVQGLKRILEASLNDSVRLIEELKISILAEDYDAMRKVAHALKGLFMNLRMTEMGVAAERMQALADKKEAIQAIEVVRKDFMRAWEAFKKEING